MVKRGDESLEERYQLFVKRKEIVLEEMRQLEKQLETPIISSGIMKLP